jgi:hypothetical protein
MPPHRRRQQMMFDTTIKGEMTMSTWVRRALNTCLISMTCVATADAALLSRLGGQAYYDDVLNITWLANANLAATNTFGVAGINAKGSMTWETANDWIAAMNSDGGIGHLGIKTWRLPTLSPIDGVSFNITLTNNATSDRGYADGEGWLDSSGSPVSEMGHMFYVNLGNLGLVTPDNSNPYRKNNYQAGSGLVNTSPISNIQSGYYWSDVASEPSSSWHFSFRTGAQSNSFDRSSLMYAWAVAPGDITAIPVPAAFWLFGSGVIALLGCAKRRR